MALVGNEWNAAVSLSLEAQYEKDSILDFIKPRTWLKHRKQKYLTLIKKNIYKQQMSSKWDQGKCTFM